LKLTIQTLLMRILLLFYKLSTIIYSLCRGVIYKNWWASRDLNPGPDDYESYQSTYIDYYYLLLIIIIYSIINLL